MVKSPILQGDDYFTVTPSDINDLAADAANPNPTEYRIASFYIGDSGSVTISLVSAHDATASRPKTFTISGPAFVPLTAKRVRATGTTATNIIALFKRV